MGMKSPISSAAEVNSAEKTRLSGSATGLPARRPVNPPLPFPARARLG
jgi:hypothetical protein